MEFFFKGTNYMNPFYTIGKQLFWTFLKSLKNPVHSTNIWSANTQFNFCNLTSILFPYNFDEDFFWILIFLFENQNYRYWCHWESLIFWYTRNSESMNIDSFEENIRITAALYQRGRPYLWQISRGSTADCCSSITDHENSVC